jgi:hypothetical protein
MAMRYQEIKVVLMNMTETSAFYFRYNKGAIRQFLTTVGEVFFNQRNWSALRDQYIYQCPYALVVFV